MPSHLPVDRALLPAAHGPPPGQYSRLGEALRLSEGAWPGALCRGRAGGELPRYSSCGAVFWLKLGGALSAATWGPPGDGARRRWPARDSSDPRRRGPPDSERPRPSASESRSTTGSIRLAFRRSYRLFIVAAASLILRRRQPRGTAPQGRCQVRCSRASRRWRSRRSAHQREAAAGRR